MAPASSDPDAAVLEDDEEEFTPTPRRPMFPVTMARLAIAITVELPWLCSVTPSP